MLFRLKVLVSTILLSTAASGLTVETSGHFEIKAQPKGIDVSNYQPNIDWKAVVANGISFVYIKATEGTCKGDGDLVVQSADISFQPTKALPSPRSTLAQPKLVSSVVDTILPFPINPLVLFRPTGSFPTEEAGVTMASPFRVRLTWNVRVIYL